MSSSNVVPSNVDEKHDIVVAVSSIESVSPSNPPTPMQAAYDNDYENYLVFQLPLLEAIRKVYQRLKQYKTWHNRNNINAQVFKLELELMEESKKLNLAKDSLDKYTSQGLYDDLPMLKKSLGMRQRSLNVTMENLSVAKILLKTMVETSNPYSQEKEARLLDYADDVERFKLLMSLLINNYSGRPRECYKAGTKIYYAKRGHSTADHDVWLYQGQIVNFNCDDLDNYYMSGYYCTLDANGLGGETRKEWTFNTTSSECAVNVESWNDRGKNLEFLPAMISYEGQVVGVDELKSWYSVFNFNFV